MTYQNQSCVDACTECISVAAYCSQACIEEQMAECAKHCLECVEICKTMAILGARDSMNMGAAMAVIMLSFMLAMYKNKGVNWAIYIGSIIVFAGALLSSQIKYETCAMPSASMGSKRKVIITFFVNSMY